MKKINRRIFIKRSVGATLGAVLLPNSFMWSKGNNQFLTFQNNDSEMLPNMNWEQMMKNHDLIWKKVPADMTEAPHFGNGLIGSMIWIEGNTIRLQVFRT